MEFTGHSVARGALCPLSLCWADSVPGIGRGGFMVWAWGWEGSLC